MRCYTLAMPNCGYCDKALLSSSRKYCSNKCQGDSRYQQYIAEWKQGRKTGWRGLQAKNMSAHLVRYLHDKYANMCGTCGWSVQHPTTGRVPLEIDHIDGNADNNSEANLRLLCPNCHALTTNYRNLNKGQGRDWRRLKYLKV
jgi:hypothetical protein